MTDRAAPGADRGSGGRDRTRFVVAGVVLLLVLAVAVVVGILASQRPDGGVASQPTGAAVPTAAPSPSRDTAQSSADRPIRTRPTADRAVDQAAATSISIAAGGVDGPLVPQGLSPDGTINPGRDEIIWFTGGDRVAPGQVGTAVIAAHVTWEGAPDAFVRLSEVGVGDVVTLGYEDGSSRSFTVTRTAAVDKEELARSLTVWGPHPRVPRLAIITCDPALGFGSDGHTEANYVVIAEA